MSFKQNHIINLGNYEEYFILYMDNELQPQQKLMVEDFISQHPHLTEELEILMNTKLPVDEVRFSGKEELFSPAMKENVLDESLLLYVDDELAASEKKTVEEKIKTDKDFSLQHSILMRTKLDASEKITYPNKKELYRHTERVVSFKIWMRVAAAVILLLLGSLFFLTNRNEKLPVDEVVTMPIINNTPIIRQENEAIPVEQLLKQQVPVQQNAPLVKIPSTKKAINPVVKNITPGDKIKNQMKNDDMAYEDNQVPKERDVIKFDAKRFTDVSSPYSFNKPITAKNVTFNFNQAYNTTEDQQEAAVTDGDFKNKKTTRAKGFFRKVSRFIERNTGIGTVNADNELLIAGLSLKLK